jgi:tagatose 6-phosphate kinase
MILAVGLNPCVERIFVIKGFTIGEVNRVERMEHLAGGKGINVARVIKALGGDPIATGFIGGEPADFIERSLEEAGISYDFVRVSAPTRSTYTILDPESGTYTVIAEPGRKVELEDVEAFLDKFQSLLASVRYVTISGTVPQGVPEDIYLRLVEKANELGKDVILDCGGKLLEEGIKGRPFGIKPNLKEFSAAIGREIKGEGDLVLELERVLDMGLGFASVTMGKEGAILVTREGRWRVVPPRIKAVNPIGSGDAFLGGLVLSLERGYGITDAFSFGTACGAAKALVGDSRFFDPSPVWDILKGVTSICL